MCPERSCPSSGTHPGRLPRAAPVPRRPRRGAARVWRCAWSFLLVVFLLVMRVLEQLPRAANLDVAAERLELEPGAAGAEGEAEAVLRLAGQLHGAAGVVLAVERRTGDRGVGLLGAGPPPSADLRS